MTPNIIVGGLERTAGSEHLILLGSLMLPMHIIAYSFCTKVAHENPVTSSTELPHGKRFHTRINRVLTLLCLRALSTLKDDPWKIGLILLVFLYIDGYSYVCDEMDWIFYDRPAGGRYGWWRPYTYCGDLNADSTAKLSFFIHKNQFLVLADPSLGHLYWVDTIGQTDWIWEGPREKQDLLKQLNCTDFLDTYYSYSGYQNGTEALQVQNLKTRIEKAAFRGLDLLLGMLFIIETIQNHVYQVDIPIEPLSNLCSSEVELAYLEQLLAKEEVNVCLQLLDEASLKLENQVFKMLFSQYGVNETYLRMVYEAGDPGFFDRIIDDHFCLQVEKEIDMADAVCMLDIFEFSLLDLIYPAISQANEDYQTSVGELGAITLNLVEPMYEKISTPS